MEDRDELDAPFFRRASTINEIEAICKQRELTIFAGAGVTIDKSGLDWNSMISALLEPHVADKDARESFVRHEGPQFAASAAHQLYVAAQDDPTHPEFAARERMVDVLRVSLYAPGTWQQGNLAASIAQFCYSWNVSALTKAQEKRKSCIVTTNYDDYLMRSLRKVYLDRVKEFKKRKADVRHLVRPVIAFPTQKDPLVFPQPARARWRASMQYPAREKLACIHLHGRIPSSMSEAWPGRLRFPVISESDYYNTAKSSEGTLTELFSRSGVVIVGASITDPPLVRALERTLDKAKRHSRWALIPMASVRHGSPITDVTERKRLISSRLKALGVTPIYVDHYVQLAQFFRELQVCASLRRPRLYSARESKHYYYARLASWWRQWNRGGAVEERQFARQNLSHYFLSNVALPALEEHLEAPNSEVLKIELWVRWRPKSQRTLRLWASSMGTWSDFRAMREAPIEDNEEFLVSECFTLGRPLLRPSRSDDPFARWGVYLAMPIWAEEPEGFDFVSAVIVVASMSSPERSSLNAETNRSNVAKSLNFLASLGRTMTRTDAEKRIAALLELLISGRH